MRYTDYYAILGLEKNSGDQEIRRAFRRLAKDFHPDMHPGDTVAEKKFKEINEAYEVLSDRQKRARYDQLGSEWNQYQDLGDIFGERPGKGRQVEFGSQIFDLNFSDFFETFFSDQAGSFWDQHGKQASQPKTEPKAQADFKAHLNDDLYEEIADEPEESSNTSQPDIQYTADISLEEALQGTKRRIQVFEGDQMHTIEVKIPAGVKDGSKVRVGSQSGNFFLEIRLRRHNLFEPDGNHLRCNVSLMDYEAMLGTLKTVPLLHGSVQMKIPPGSQAGQTFRIRNQGLPDLKNTEQRGDILATLEIKVSKDLTDEERSLIERFKLLREQKAAQRV